MAQSADEDQGIAVLPWSRAAGLLVGCTAAVAGAFQGVGISYLLLRAAGGSFVAFLIVGCFVRLVSLMMPDPDSSSSS